MNSSGCYKVEQVRQSSQGAWTDNLGACDDEASDQLNSSQQQYPNLLGEARWPHDEQAAAVIYKLCYSWNSFNAFVWVTDCFFQAGYHAREAAAKQAITVLGTQLGVWLLDKERVRPQYPYSR